MRKYILGLISIIGIGLINFSSAGYTYKLGDGSTQDFVNSPYNSNYKFQTIQNGGFSSSFGGTYKLLIYPGDFNNFNGFLFRDYNGLPYFYVSSQGNGRTNQNMITGHFNQGEITKYYLCNKLNSGDTSINNCNEYTIGEGFYDFIVSYLSGVNIDDYYYIDFGGLHNDWYDLVNLTYCISSNSIGNSICFKASSCFNRSPSIPNCEIYSFPSELNSLYDYFTLAEDFSTVPNSILNFPPDGNSNGNTNNTTNTNQYTCATIQQLINTYPEQYNTGLCYSNNIIFSGGTIQNVTPKTIFEEFETLIEFTNEINNYNNYCKPPATTETCQGIFQGKEEKRQIINKIPNNVDPIKLYQYCNLSLNYNPTQTTCTANTGTTQQIGSGGININDIITEIGQQEYTVIKPGKPTINGTGRSGSVFDEIINTENETQRRNVVKNAQDIINTMKELYTKFTGIFANRNGNNGIIPRYITSLMLLIVLFKLFKK